LFADLAPTAMANYVMRNARSHGFEASVLSPRLQVNILSVGPKHFSQEIFITSVGDLKLNFEFRKYLNRMSHLENILSSTS